MLFNSLEFILLFFPVVWLGFVKACRVDPRAGVLWLSLASLVFYTIWNWHHAALLVSSTLANFLIGKAILQGSRPRGWCAAGVTLNLLVLAVCKYAAFAVTNWNAITGMHVAVPVIELPPGISFFTFTQIAFLVDAARGAVQHRHELASYSLFVNYFPHLIAGPVLHHRSMIPQFERISAAVPAERITSGVVLFAIGMGKKMLLADPLAHLATPVFDAAGHGTVPPLLAAWTAVIAFAFQIYFDFSGYSDMAVGLSRLFGIELPVNFRSPYKADSIIEFWRRWHISLSSFLRDYLYIPLGGSRLGPMRTRINLMLTMLLGGLWHGASWNFVLWGGLHGLFLTVNHLWRGRLRPPFRERPCGAGLWSDLALVTVLAAVAVVLSPKWGWVAALVTAMHWWHCRTRDGGGEWARRVVCGGGTFLAVLTAWVLFRAPDMAGVWAMFRGMLAGGVSQSAADGLAALGATQIGRGQQMLVLAAMITWLAPGAETVVSGIVAAPRRISALAAGTLLFAALVRIGAPSQFLYFQF